MFVITLEDFRREVARWLTHWVITKRNDLPTTLCTTLDSVNPVLYPSIDTILIKLCVLLTMSVASATVVLTGHLATVYGGVWKIVLGRP